MSTNPTSRAQSVTARINGLLANLLTLPGFRETDDFTQLVSEYLEDSGYDEASRAASALYASIEAALPPQHRTLIGQFSDKSGTLAWAESMAAFDLGQRTEAAIANRRTRPALERVINVLQVAAGQMTPDEAAHLRVSVGRLQQAVPVAKAILLTGEAICPDANALDNYLRIERERVLAQPDDPTDSEHACAVAAAHENAIYYTALALGLLLSEAV